MPHKLVSSHSNSATSCTSAPTPHPDLRRPAKAACAYYHRGSDALAPAHTALRTVPSRLGLPRTLRFRQEGTPMIFVCVKLCVRYISMNFRPTSAEVITVPTTFPRSNWPQCHPAKPPTHAPTAPPATPRATTALLLRIPASSLRLTTAARAKSPRDAAATATVVNATTVATIYDLRWPWRPHLPPVSQEAMKARPPHSCGQGHNLQRARSLPAFHNQVVSTGAYPRPVCVRFLS